MQHQAERALTSIAAVGGADGRRPMLMGVIAQAGVGFFYAHLDRWAALFDHRDQRKPLRLRDPRLDLLDDSGTVTREGKVDVLARLAGPQLTLFYGTRIGQMIAEARDVGGREVYTVDPAEFATFAEACRLTARNDRAVARLVAEISQQRRRVDPDTMVVDVEL